MTIEDERERRGEPVRFSTGLTEHVGTIEWGNDRLGYMVCTEPGGARLRVMAKDLRTDPGGLRPLWSKRHGPRPLSVREAAVLVVESSIKRAKDDGHGGYGMPDVKALDDLNEALRR